MSSPAKPLAVVALLGISHCGSTLLNLMLDVHPAIYGGGELHHLLDPDSTLKECTNCGAACPHWTPERLAGLQKDDFYADIADLFGVDVIVDTSKTPLWFHNIRNGISRRPLRVIPVVMVREPLAQLASLIMHAVSRECQDAEEVERAFYADPKERLDAINLVLSHRILVEYQLIFRTNKAIFGSDRLFLVRYEQVVTNPAAELAPLMAELGLAYDPAMTRCYEMPHHQIAGNQGALYQYHRNEEGIQGAQGLREGFYKATKGIRLDDKHQYFFTDQEVRHLHAQPLVQSIRHCFGYGGDGLVKGIPAEFLLDPKPDQARPVA